MKKWRLLFFLIFSVSSFAQVIQGTVFDDKKKPLEGASVYLDGTTTSTTTDENGKFNLYVKVKINTSLVIRYLGYETVFIANSFNQDYQNIYLSLKQEALKEIVIVKGGFSRKDKMKIFKEFFLGKTVAGRSCSIENEDDIYFTYDYGSNVLMANSDVPIIVKNEYLGYQVQFDLYEFNLKFYQKSIKSEDVTKSLYLGTALFSDVAKQAKEEARRDKIYKGSSMHFYKNLSENLWNKDNFLLFRKRFLFDPSLFFKVEDTGGLKKVTILINDLKDVLLQGTKPKFYASVDILFKKNDQSQIIFKTDTFYIDSFGNNSNIHDIEYNGDFSTKKIGDLLPINFKPKEEIERN